MMLSKAVEATQDRWNVEARMFCARHGRNGGKFVITTWANGQKMAGVPGARGNQSIPVRELFAIAKVGFQVYS